MVESIQDMQSKSSNLLFLGCMERTLMCYLIATIYMQFNLVPYRHRIDELWAVLASSKSFKYLYYYSHKIADALGSEKCKAFFSACLQLKKNSIWATCWIAFDEETSALCSLGSIPADEGYISAVQLLVVHFSDHTNSAIEVNWSNSADLERNEQWWLYSTYSSSTYKIKELPQYWSCLFISVPLHWIATQTFSTVSYTEKFNVLYNILKVLRNPMREST